MNESSNTNTTNQSSPEDSLDRVMQARLEKLERIRSLSFEPFPYEFNWTHTTAGILDAWNYLTGEDVHSTLAGALCRFDLGKLSAKGYLGETLLAFKRRILASSLWDTVRRLRSGDRLVVSGEWIVHNSRRDFLRVAAVYPFNGEDSADAGEQTHWRPRVAGRIISIRLMGKSAFAHIQDHTGRLQIYFKKDSLGETLWNLFKELDIGDIVGVEGHPFVTHTGEKSLHAVSFTLLAKNLRPLPAVKEKGDHVWFKWDDKEERYRQRTLDLILNRESREKLELRSRLVYKLREFFIEKDFIEVETPVLQTIYGGASAKPFITRHNALNRDLFLRIADELYLKRLIAGGMPRVFEIAKDFRNEGIDRLHSPEFTMLEAYIAYENYSFLMDLMEELLPRLTFELLGKYIINLEGVEIDLRPPYQRIPMSDAIRDATGVEIAGADRETIARWAAKLGVETTPSMGIGKIIDELFSTAVQPGLMQPTFIIDHPKALSSLAKKHRSNPDLVERFELFIGGMEVVNAFSELNDPLDQRRRFEQQARLRAEGDEEAAPLDEDFLQALEVGMPPTAGLGMGVDRITMLLSGAGSIRDVILFPLLRPRS